MDERASLEAAIERTRKLYVLSSRYLRSRRRYVAPYAVCSLVWGCLWLVPSIHPIIPTLLWSIPAATILFYVSPKARMFAGPTTSDDLLLLALPRVIKECIAAEPTKVAALGHVAPVLLGPRRAKRASVLLIATGDDGQPDGFFVADYRYERAPLEYPERRWVGVPTFFNIEGGLDQTLRYLQDRRVVVSDDEPEITMVTSGQEEKV